VGDERLQRYIEELFAVEDPVLARVRARHAEQHLPPIHISPDEGKLLHVLLRAVAARRVLEIGSLAGYSGIWLARALPSGGMLTTIEKHPLHAALARRAYAEAGVADRAGLVEGEALTVLGTLSPGFDAVFVDADKEPLVQYFEHSVPCSVPAACCCATTHSSMDRWSTRTITRRRSKACAPSTVSPRPTLASYRP
jgi:predicted O-methyltransferase YrrM